MPDPTPTLAPAFVPPDQAKLAADRKWAADLLAGLDAPASAEPSSAPAVQPATAQESLPVPVQAVPATVKPLGAGATDRVAVPAPPAIQGSDKTLMEMTLGRERVPQIQAIPTQKPETFDPLGMKAAKQDVVNVAARAGVAPSQFASDVTRKAMESSAQARGAVNQRVTDYLKTRGYDEPVSLVGDKINLPATVQRMEAAALTKRAQAMGYGDWFQVPPGPDAQKIREEVNQQVAADLRHATTVGRGAIFVDPDPAHTEEWLSTLPVTWAVTLASLLPHAEATWTPKGMQLRTEPVIITALRPVGAPVTAAATLGKAALNTGLVDKWGAAKELSTQAFAAEQAGDIAQGDILHQQAEDARVQAMNDALAAATGKAAWRDIFLDPLVPGVGQDPEAVKNLVQIARTDRLAVMVADDLADDIERVYKPDGFTMDAIRGTLWGAGLLADFFGPEPVTPTIAAAGQAARYGMRLEGAADDLLKGAKAIRTATDAQTDIQGVMDAARAAYPGMEEALKLRIAARARVQPEIVSQVRALEVHAKELAAKVPVAEAKLVEAREATDIAAAGRELAQARFDAARAQTELATAHRALTEDALAQWDAYGADNVKRAESLMETVDDLKRQARAEEKNVQAAEARNAPRRAEIDKANEQVQTWEQLRNAADDEVEAAQAALLDSKNLRGEDQGGGKWRQAEAQAAGTKSLEQLQAEHKALVAEVDDVVAMAMEKRGTVLKEANDAVAKASERLKTARAAKQDKATIDRLKAEVAAAKEDVARLRTQYDADVEQARELANKARKAGFEAILNARSAMRQKPPGTTYTDIEAEWADEIAYREADVARAKAERKAAKANLKAALEDQERLLKDYAPYIQEQMRDTERLLRLQKQAAQAESEAGWRILSVADDGKAADAALENGQGVLREAGLMPDINPLDAKSTREMIERGKLWGQGLRDAHAEAGRRVGAAMDDYRKAHSMLRGATRETREAAEASLDRLRALGEAQYGREIAEGRAKVWREEALALANDVERGVASLKKRPKDMSERATNLLDGAIVNTAKDGTRTLDTAAFRAKIEGLFTKDGVAWWLRHAGDDAPLWRQALGFEPKGDWTWRGSREALEQEVDAANLAAREGTDPAARQPLLDDIDNQRTFLNAVRPKATRSVPRTETPEFKEWFKGSKVVDENGNPMIMFHGTGERFDKFAPKGHRGALYYFHEDLDFAQHYAETRMSRSSPEFEAELQNGIARGDFSNRYIISDPEKFVRSLDDNYDVVLERISKRLGKSYHEADANEVARAFEGLAREHEESLKEGLIVPAYLHAERPHGSKTDAMHWTEVDAKGRDWFAANGYDAVWTRENGGSVSLAVLDSDQIRGIHTFPTSVPAPKSTRNWRTEQRLRDAEQALRDFDARPLRDDTRLNRAILALDNVRQKPPPTIKLSPGEALALQEGQRGLLQGLQRTAGDAAAVNQTEALLALRRDPSMTGPGFMNMTPNQWGQYVVAKYEHWKRMLDPMVAKVGDADEAVVRVSRMGARRAAIHKDELLMLGRLARAPAGWRGFWKRTADWGGTPEIIAAHIRYMDSTEALQVFGRTTFGNRGPEKLWSKTRRQILGSKSLSESDAVARLAATEAADDAATARWQLFEARAEATDGDIANRPLLGLSRAWWPASVDMNSRASARLWGAAIEELKRNDTFEGFMEAMKAQTKAITKGAVEYIPDLAYSFAARNACQAAVQADVGDYLVREIGGLFTAEEAADVNRALHADGDMIESMNRTWEGYARMGAPFTQRATRDGARAVAQQQELVRIATTRSGEDVFALATQSRALDDTLDKVIKETYARHAGSRNIGESTIARHALDLQQWWKTSVTIGLIGPNPRYFMNNFFGNISQIWLTQGLGTAARMSFQGAPSVIPGIGVYFDRAMRASSEAMGDVPVLGSMMNALINPHLNKFFGGEPGTFRAANGIVYDLDTVRQWAADDGALTSFMQEEYGRLFARSRGNSMFTRFSHLQDDLYAWANEIEIRQRSALYLDLLRQGYTRSAARERTLRALYDWHGALTPFESSYVTTAVPFYRFMKLGFKQAWYEAIAKPLIKPTEATAEALRGSSGLARMRNQGMLLRLPELADDGQYETEADKFDAMSRYRNLDYLNKRIAWTERNDPATIDMYQGGRGQFMPFRTVTLPAMTAIDMGNLVALTMYALPAMAMGVAGALGMTDQKWTSADAMQPYWNEASNMAGPIAAPFIAQLAQKAGYDSTSQQEIVRLKPGEAALAQAMGLSVGVGKDYQSTVASAGTAAFVRGFPVVLQIPQWLDALNLENPHTPGFKAGMGRVAAEPRSFVHDTQFMGDAARYLAWGAGQVTNFTRSFPFDPDNNLTQRQKKIAEDLKGTADSQEGSVREKQVTPP